MPVKLRSLLPRFETYSIDMRNPIASDASQCLAYARHVDQLFFLTVYNTRAAGVNNPLLYKLVFRAAQAI